MGIRYLLTLTLTLLVVGCEIKGHVETKPLGETTSVNDCISCEINELEEPYIGEYYFDQYALCDSDGICITKHGWYKFKKNDVLDKHNNEIKLENNYWTEKFFYYSDIPDQYQKKREEIEDKIKLSSKSDVIYSTSGCFHEPTEESKNCLIRNGYIPEKGKDGQILDFVDYEWKWVDPPEEKYNFEVSGTLKGNFQCQHLIIYNPEQYIFEIKNGQLEARCKE